MAALSDLVINTLKDQLYAFQAAGDESKVSWRLAIALASKLTRGLPQEILSKPKAHALYRVLLYGKRNHSDTFRLMKFSQVHYFSSFRAREKRLAEIQPKLG